MASQGKAETRRPWQEIAAEAQKLRDDSLLEVEGVPDLPDPLPHNVMGVPDEVLSDRAVEITSLSLDEVVRLTSSGALTAVEVTKAFLQRCVLAQKMVTPSFSPSLTLSHRQHSLFSPHSNPR